MLLITFVPFSYKVPYFLHVYSILVINWNRFKNIETKFLDVRDRLYMVFNGNNRIER